MRQAINIYSCKYIYLDENYQTINKICLVKDNMVCRDRVKSKKLLLLMTKYLDSTARRYGN